MNEMRPPADESAIETPLVLFILILVVAPLIFFGVRYEMKARAEAQAQAKREIGYQATLRSYSQVLKPGMTRKEIEGYFHTKNINFVQTCCVEPSKKHSLDDLVEIGKDAAPWFCSENIAYLAFEFIDQEQHGTDWDSNDADTLKAVSIYHRAEGCL
jgi:hypothetical protein